MEPPRQDGVVSTAVATAAAAAAAAAQEADRPRAVSRTVTVLWVRESAGGAALTTTAET